MRKLGPIFTAILILLAASFVSPVAASASGAARLPGPPGPHSGARSSALISGAAGIRRPSVAVPAAITCDGQFDLVASPNRTGNNYLDGTSAVSANDVWAVGNSTNSSNFDRTLAEHWNGTTWSIVPTANSGSLHNDLFSVSAISSSNVWAVGVFETNDTTGTASTLAEHWNGTSWSIVTTKNPSTYSYLFGVTAVSSSNVWAVGSYFNFTTGTFHTLIEHYNGASWAVVPSDNFNLSDDNQLFAVSAFSRTDVWAVGSYGPFPGTLQSLAEHWNGVTWTVLTVPNTLTGDNEILGVTALEAGHAVGVGYGGFVNAVSPRQAVDWDLVVPGSSTIFPRGGSTGGDNVFEGVARASGSLWAVGFTRATTLAPRQTLAWAATWDSTAHTLTWTSSPATSANPGATNSVLFGVEAISPSVFWATGYENNGGSDQTLTEVYCGLKFGLAAPATAVSGVPFALTVTAMNPDNSTATGYGGTVHFTSSDPQAVLPADYTFLPADAGLRTFTGVVLLSPYNQPTTITVSDTVTPFINATASITVACPGVCQSSSGTPGDRTTTPGPGGTPGDRTTNPGPAGTPALRTAARPGAVAAGTRLPTAAPARVNLAAPTSSRAITGRAAAPAVAIRITGPVPARATTHLASGAAPTYTMALAARSAPVSPPPGQTPWYLPLLLPLLLTGLVLLVRLRQLRS